VPICSEHAIRLLKGTSQSLKELCIKITDKKRHLKAIVWIRCCIILHNLIICIEEGNDVDDEWRGAITAGLALTDHQQEQREQHNRRGERTDLGDESLGDEAVEGTDPGFTFHQVLMDKLFNSPYSNAE